MEKDSYYLKFESEEVSAKSLEAGDFFAVIDAKDLTELSRLPTGAGVSLYIRTDMPYPAHKLDEKLHKITIKRIKRK